MFGTSGSRSGRKAPQIFGTSAITGAGTLDYHAKFTPSGTVLGNSLVKDDGTNIFWNIPSLGAGNFITWDTANVAADQTLSIYDAHSSGGVVMLVKASAFLPATIAANSIPFVSGTDTWFDTNQQLTFSGATLQIGDGTATPIPVLRLAVSGSRVSEISMDNSGVFTGRMKFVDTGANGGFEFKSTNGSVCSRYTDIQDGMTLRGRAGGIDSYSVELVPTTLTARRTATFQDFDGTVALLDLAQSFTGIQTFKDGIVIGEALDTSGRIGSNVAVDSTGTIQLLYKPNAALTSNSDRFIHSFQNSAGTVGLAMRSDQTWQFGGGTPTGGYINVTANITQDQGILFLPVINDSTSVATIAGKANSITAAQFAVAATNNTSPTGYVIGGTFTVRGPVATSGNIPAALVAAMFRPGDTLGANSGITFPLIGGWRTVGPTSTMTSGTFTDCWGGYIENWPSPASGQVFTNLYGLYIEEQTRGATINNGIFLANATSGRKLIAFRDQNAWIGSNSAGELTLTGTTITANTYNVGRGTQTEVDFGSTPVSSTKFTITDTNVAAGTKIIAALAYEAPTGRTIDEVEMEFVNIHITAGNVTAATSFEMYVGSATGLLSGKYKINYSLY